MKTLELNCSKKEILSLIMRFAHLLKKEKNISFSEALKESWATWKQNVSEVKRVSIMDYTTVKDWNKFIKKVHTYYCYQKFYNDKDKTNDFIGDVILKINKKIHKFNPNKTQFYTWCLNIAKHQFIDNLRKRKLMTESLYNEFSDSEDKREEKFKDSAPLQDELMSKETIYNNLHNVVENIKNETLRAIIKMVYFEEMSIEEISQTLNINEPTVRVYKQRALNILKDQLSK